MKMAKSLKHFGSLILIIALVICPYFLNNLRAEPVTFKAVSWLPKKNPTMKAFDSFVTGFNKEFKGEAAIKWIGGPEVIPMFQLHESVRTGMMDMVNTSSAFYVSLTPVSYSIMFSNKTINEMYQSGFFDTFTEIHKKVGLMYLGVISYGSPFYIYLNERIKSPEGLVGKKIRVFPAVAPFIKTLGAVPINMKSPDIYTAMDRGVIDGFVMSAFGVVKTWSWQEVTKYIIKHDFYSGYSSLLVNPKSWNRLSQDLQKRIIDWKYKVFDPIATEENIIVEAGQTKLVLDNIETIEFSQADAKRYLDTAYKASWDKLFKEAPDVAPKLKAILLK